LTGAAIGETHARELRRLVLESALSDGDIVALDFSGVESASASYLKRIIDPFFGPSGGSDDLPTAAVPILLNADSGDLREDLQDHLEGKGRVLVIADEIEGGLRFNRLIGTLDRAATETYQELCRAKEVTAQQLYDRFPGRTTNQTAWNNRLAQLLELRIARRRREGRLWIYQPTVTV
jgi:hypothetical protein